MNQEIEIKYRVLDRNALVALERCACKLFPGSTVKQVHQTNFFFDSDDLRVRSNGFGVRLRQEDERYLLTLKGPNGQKKSKPSKVTQRLEFEAPVSHEQAQALLSGTHNVIWIAEHLEPSDEKMKHTRDHLLERIKKACNPKALAIIGSFTNARRILPITINGEAMKVEFDSTQFSDSAVHYEVELEIPSMDMLSAAEAFLANLFAQCGLIPTRAKSKSERFYSFLDRD